MTDKYWVGGGGNINDMTHWSLSSGGSGGSAIPQAPDDVYFDANSGTGVIAIAGGLNCKDVYASDIASGLSFSGLANMIFYGTSLNWKSGVDCPFIIYGYGPSIATFDFKGVLVGGFYLDQDVTLLSNVMLNNTLVIKTGSTFDVNGYDISLLYMNMVSSVYGGTVNMGSGTWTTTHDYVVNGTYGVINGETSTLIITNSFAQIKASTTRIFNNVSCPNATTVVINTDTCTLNTLTVKDGGCTVKLLSGKTVNISGLSIDGVASKNSLQATSAGSQATLNLVSGTKTLDNLNIKDIAATPSSTWTAENSSDDGNNTGITFIAATSSGSALFFGSNF
jgi:hypothetical protein